MFNPEQRQAIRQDARFDQLVDSVTVAEGILAMAEGRVATGAWGEIGQEMERRHGVSAHGITLRVPFRKLVTRGDIVGVFGQGGSLVAIDTTAPADALRSNGNICASLGAQVIAAGAGNVNVPKLTGIGTSYALAENANVTASSHAYGQTTLVPKSFGVLNEISRQLLIQSSNVARDFAAADQAAILARTVDYQALLGAGINGECTGIKIGGSSSFSGTTLALAGLQTVVTGIGDAVGRTFGFATTKAVASALRQRPELSGSTKTLWTGNIVAGQLIDFPALSTSNISTGHLFAGEWKYLVITLWGGGLELQVNPYENGSQQWQKGIVQVRTFLTLDTALIYPSAFQYATTVT